MLSSNVNATHALESRGVRQRAVADVKRAHVLAAARTAFFELGLDGASMREIARRAGYTPGAIYSYFASKEEIYGALLGESLERLNASVAQAFPTADADAVVVVGAHARAQPRSQGLAVRVRVRSSLRRPPPSSTSSARTRATSTWASTCSRACARVASRRHSTNS